MPEHVRDAALEEIGVLADFSSLADENFKIGIHLKVKQNVVTTYDIAEALGRSQSVISNWSREGEQALERRRREAAERSGDAVPHNG